MEPGDARSMPGNKLTPVNKRPRAPLEAQLADASMQHPLAGTMAEEEDEIKRLMHEAKVRMAAALPEIVEGLIIKAQNGNAGAAKLIMEILEGKRRFYKMAAEHAVKEEQMSSGYTEEEINEIRDMF